MEVWLKSLAVSFEDAPFLSGDSASAYVAVKDPKPCKPLHAENTTLVFLQVRIMRRKADHTTKSKDTASERSRKRMATHVRAARASKLASNPGCMSFFTLPHFFLGHVQCTGNLRANPTESKIERV